MPSRPVYTISPCSGCVTDPCGEGGTCLSCETLGTGRPGEGGLFLCGFPEYTSPSTPPRFFKTEQIAGEWVGCRWSTAGSSCPDGGAGADGSYDPDNSRRHIWSGSTSKNASCSGTSGDALDTIYKLNDCADDPGSLYTTFGGGIPPSGAGFESAFTFTEDQTEQRWEGNGTCDNASNPTLKGTGTVTKTLVDEIAGEAALDWLEDSYGSSWGPGECSAFYYARTGEVLHARKCRWTLSKAGLLASTYYDFTITYWRRTIDEEGDPGEWELFQTDNLNEVTNSEGVLSYGPVEVPNVEGYETEVRCDCTFTPSA